MRKVSVLMSVYNETKKEITESINSILNQTHKNFEFLIINDNPSRKELNYLLNEFKIKDERIKIVNNKKNIGLAFSLNRVAEIATSDIFVRMDADDISLDTRIEEQLSEIENGYDLVFSPYTYIDEQSNTIKLINDNLKVYTPYEIHKTLPIKNIIHHPTVMVTRDVFKKAGGYRGFKVAQDYDLWLRIYDVGGKFKMTDKALLKYRIRESSVSRQKKYLQKVTLDYTRELFLERVSTGEDSFSLDSYEIYLHRHNAYERSETDKLRYFNRILSRAKQAYSNNNYMSFFYYRFKVFLLSKTHRDHYFNTLTNKMKLKKYINRNLKINNLI